jgi:hypothetical protein
MSQILAFDSVPFYTRAELGLLLCLKACQLPGSYGNGNGNLKEERTGDKGLVDLNLNKECKVPRSAPLCRNQKFNFRKLLSSL